MKYRSGIFVLYAFVLLGVLLSLSFEGMQDVRAASQQNNLTVDQILENIENKYTNSKFTADFIQRSTIKAMNITDTATGKVYIKYPGMMRWEYQKPDRQIIITDGDQLWIYRPEDHQVLTGKAPTFFSDGKGASFLSDIGLIRQKFDISLEQNPTAKDDPFYHLRLIPREKTMDISEIRLMVSKKSYNIVQVVTFNFYGDETRIDFINFKFDVNLDDSLFSFTVPPGTDVLQIDE